MQLPQLAYIEKRNEIILRYYTATQAIEYRLPSSSLRYHDPLTGSSTFCISFSIYYRKESHP